MDKDIVDNTSRYRKLSPQQTIVLFMLAHIVETNDSGIIWCNKSSQLSSGAMGRILQGVTTDDLSFMESEGFLELTADYAGNLRVNVTNEGHVARQRRCYLNRSQLVLTATFVLSEGKAGRPVNYRDLQTATVMARSELQATVENMVESDLLVEKDFACQRIVSKTWSLSSNGCAQVKKIFPRIAFARERP